MRARGAVWAVGVAVAAVAATAAFGVPLGLLVAAVGGVLTGVLAVAPAAEPPWQALADVIAAVAAGQRERRLYVGEGTDERLVNAALDRLGERLAALERSERWLGALLEQLDEAVLVIDAQSNVLVASRAARRLAPEEGDLVGRHLYSALGRTELVRLVEEARQTGAVARTEWTEEGGRAYRAWAAATGGGEVLIRIADQSEERRTAEMRRDFVANVSHELRTPLTLIAGYAETLTEEGLAAEDVRRFADVVLRESRRLARLVDDLLRLSEAEGGRPPELEPVRPYAIAAEVLGRFERVARRRGVELVLQGDAQAVALGHPGHVDQVLTNLVDNAIRYSPPGAAVVVEVAAAPERVRVSVTDRGPGIPPGELARIFERFYRVDKSHSRPDEGGAGLGLAIARHLAERMRGTLTVESEVGRGSTFTLTLLAADGRSA